MAIERLTLAIKHGNIATNVIFVKNCHFEKAFKEHLKQLKQT